MVSVPTKANVTHPAAEGYGALLTWGDADAESLYVQLAPSSSRAIERATGQATRQMPNLAANPEDFRPESGMIFSRSRWSGGEGLARAHRPDPTPDDGKRFWDSSDMHIVVPAPGETEEFYLAWAQEEIDEATVCDTPHAVKVAEGVRVFFTDGLSVRRSDDLLAAAPTCTAENPGTLSGEGAQTVTGLALLGRTLYAALDGAGSIHKRTWAGAWTAWSDLQAESLWSAKGRVIASNLSGLYEAAEAATSVALKLIDDNETWTSVIDAGHLILAAATDGNIYAFEEQAGSLVLVGETPMRPGEVPRALAFEDGLVFIGVGDENYAGGHVGRLYVAQLAGNRLRGTRQLQEWGTAASALNHAPCGMTSTRTEVLVPVLDDGGKLAVWSYLLETAGTYKRMTTAVAQRPRQALMLDDRVVLFRDAAKPLREHATEYAATGWIMTPYADWWSAAQKAIIGLRIDNEDIPAAGATIALYYTTDPDALNSSVHASWVLAKTLAFDGDLSEADEIALLGVTGRGVAMMVKVARSTVKTDTPVGRSVSVRAFEDIGDVVLTVPVNVSDVIERPGKKPLRVPGRGEAVYAVLLTREGQSGQIEVLRTSEKVKGRVERVAKSEPAVAARGPSMLVAMVTARGVRV